MRRQESRLIISPFSEQIPAMGGRYNHLKDLIPEKRDEVTM
jgi:hypothetical protein